MWIYLKKIFPGFTHKNINNYQRKIINITEKIDKYLKKHRDGVFRYHFGQVKKITNRKWTAEIRDSSTGALVRNAGEWSSKKDTIEEIKHILKTDHLCEG